MGYLGPVLNIMNMTICLIKTELFIEKRAIRKGLPHISPSQVIGIGNIIEISLIGNDSYFDTVVNILLKF